MKKSTNAFLVAAAVWPFIEVSRERGEPVELGLSSVGLSQQDLQSAGDRVSQRRLNQLLHMTVAGWGCRERGLLAAQRLTPGHFGLVEFAMRTQPTIGEGLRKLEQLGPLLHDGLEVRLTVEGSRCAVQLSFEREPLHCAGVEFAAAALVRHIRFASGDAAHAPAEVYFAHHAPLDVSQYRKLFHCPVQFGANGDGIVLHAADLERPSVWADELGARALASSAQQALEALRTPDGVERQVEAAVERLLEDGSCDAAGVARELGMTLRTLQRKLASSRVSVSEIIDRRRACMADNYLRNPRLTFDEIAHRLGFGSTPGFHRAMRRWTHQTAAQRRRLLLQREVSVA